MTDQTAFSAEEWDALGEAPMQVIMAMMAAGEHGPISMVKESSAAMRVISRPGNRAPADELIGALAKVAESKEVRKDVGHEARAQKGSHISDLIDVEVKALGAAKAALAKVSAEEAAQVGGWLVDIAREMANVSKGVNEHESSAIAKLQALFGLESA